MRSSTKRMVPAGPLVAYLERAWIRAQAQHRTMEEFASDYGLNERGMRRTLTVSRHFNTEQVERMLANTPYFIYDFYPELGSEDE